ncbi:MAG TPA: YcaO-like family protein [Archangium sp.]|uniref:YcaO-like family protein n=1 Tax=Archangium sp. TaxID=1872627 RepID=UPI002ED99248
MIQTSPKGFHSGTHRLVPPEATVARVQGLLPIMGITRVANVTGLDTIGIPVVMVIRPNARSLSVSQGKGGELASARASGLMEAIELYHAEHITHPLKLATFNELRFTHRMVDVTALPALSISQFHGHFRTLWIEGRSLFDEGSTWVPYELVHMDYTLPLPSGSGSFLMSSSGLASGNHPLEAVNHALCELIERDATTLFRLSGEQARHRLRVDPATVDDPGCRALLEQYARARVEVGKRLFHADRSWPGLLKKGREAGLDAAGLEACRRFVAESRVDQKRLDGLSLLRTLRARLEAGLPPKQTRYAFAHTDSWEHIRQKAEAVRSPRSEG